MSNMLVNKNLTITKAAKFAVTSFVGVVIVTGLTYTLTEYVDLYYLLAVAISGATAFAIKFVVNAIWTFKD